nr:putative integron gene cassette protein [uncultured bacterium]
MLNTSAIAYTYAIISWLSGFYFFWSPLLGIAILLLLNNNPFSKDNFRYSYLLIFGPFLIAPIILTFGAVMGVEPHPHYLGCSEKPVTHFIGILFYIQIAFGIGIIYSMKGYRWFALSITLFQIAVSYSASFISVMSITGCWL